MHFDLADGLGEAACGFGVGVRVGEVRLDVDDGRSVHQIGAGDDDFGPFRTVEINLLDFYARKRDRVRAEARTRGENAQALVAAQSRRAHGRTPSVADVLRKNPHDPQVAKAFETAERVGITKFWLEAYRRAQVLHKPALSRDAKLFSKIALDSRNNFKRNILHVSSVIHDFGCLFCATLNDA